MATRLKSATVPISREIGRMRTIPPNRARDEDLHVFLGMTRYSFAAVRHYIRRAGLG
jgi:hypothetical protein